MARGTVEPGLAARALGARTRRDALARAFAGLTTQRVVTFLGLCLVWAASNSVHEFLIAWRENDMRSWFVERLGGEFVCMVGAATVMAIPLMLVGNLGPQEGWRRYVLLALTVLLVAPLAGGVRYYYYTMVIGWSPSTMRPEQYAIFLMRFALLASLFTAFVEFQRRETRSIESMHRAEIDRVALDREMDEARLQVMQAQIEPHFLFNTLATVRRLYRTEPQTGRTMLQDLMRYLEVALPRMRESRSTLGQELALAEAYLGVQRIRMGRRLAFEIDVPVALRRLELPPMMLLTLVENAIKHGLNALPEGGFIRIAARVDGGRLLVEVADTGVGFQATSGGGTGLANIRARLAAMHGTSGALTLVENRPRGVTATIALPASQGAPGHAGEAFERPSEMEAGS